MDAFFACFADLEDPRDDNARHDCRSILYRVCQIADRLDVSVDRLVGRSNVMEVLGRGQLRPAAQPHGISAALPRHSFSECPG
jgi:hypothetical protein